MKYCPYTLDVPPLCEECTNEKCEQKKRERELNEWVKPFVDELDKRLN